MLQLSPTFMGCVSFGLIMMFINLSSYIFEDKQIEKYPNLFGFFLLCCVSVSLFVPYYYGLYEIVITDQFPKRPKKLGRFEKAIERY